MWILSIILGTAICCFYPAHCQHINQPNIVFIMADDVGYNDVGYHNPKITTPNLDKLCRQGVRLENYYVQPICSPTRSQFMSGRYQIHTGLQHGIIRPKQPLGLPLDSLTLADKLREVGYSTYAVGKWHLGYYKKEYLPTRRGFDRFYGLYMGHLNHFTHRRCMGKNCGVDLHYDTKDRFSHVFNESGVYSTHLFTNKANDWIREHNNTKPFFLYLSYQAAHGPLQVPPKYERPYRNIRDQKRRKFSAMMTAMDEGIGQLVEMLKKEGVWENTVLVFSTDNGAVTKKGGSNSPLRGHKGSLFEGGVRAVGFVNSPLLERTGYTSNELMHVTDWFPTFINLANGTYHGTFDLAGFDQWASLSKNCKSERVELLHNIDPLTRAQGALDRESNDDVFDVRISAAIRSGKYKLITGVGKTKKYNTDPDLNHGKNMGRKNRNTMARRGKGNRRAGRNRKHRKMPKNQRRSKKNRRRQPRSTFQSFYFDVDKIVRTYGSQPEVVERPLHSSTPGLNTVTQPESSTPYRNMNSSSTSVSAVPTSSTSAPRTYNGTTTSSFYRTRSTSTTGTTVNSLTENQDIYEDIPPRNFQYLRLFDIEKDPNERRDISKLHPEIVMKLLHSLKKYHLQSRPPNNPPNESVVPKNGGWGPWRS